MRLTFINKRKGGIFDCEKELLAFNKLGQLEDIEEELGIDLATLINVLKNGIYDKQGKYYYPHLEYLDDEYRKEWILVEEQGDYRPNLWFHFKDYGKIWALTKEDLL